MYKLEGLLAVGSWQSDTVQIWDILTGTLKSTFSHPETNDSQIESFNKSSIHKIVALEDGLLASVAKDDTILYIWNLTSERLHSKVNIEAKINCLVYLNDHFIAVGTFFGIKVFKKIGQLFMETTNRVHVRFVSDLQPFRLKINENYRFGGFSAFDQEQLFRPFNYDSIQHLFFLQRFGRYLLSLSNFGEAKVWDIFYEKGRLIYKITLERKLDFWYLYGKFVELNYGYLAMASAFNVKTWNYRTGELKCMFKANNDSIVLSLELIGVDFLAGGFSDRTIHIWDYFRCEIVMVLDNSNSDAKSCGANILGSLTSSSFVSACVQGQIKFWNISSLVLLK